MQNTLDPRDYLEPTRYADSNAASVQRFVRRALTGHAKANPREKAVALFNAVRDGLRYDPYRISLDPAAYRASAVAEQPAAFCIPKSILLTAVARAAGIPAAAGFSDVRNHLTSPKLDALMGCDLFIWHGYTALWLDGRWVKATPAFNMELCERFGVKPLVFDGESDALFHEFDTQNRRHMEYVNERGLFLDPPVDRILAEFREIYPGIVKAWESGESARMKDVAFHG